VGNLSSVNINEFRRLRKLSCAWSVRSLRPFRNCDGNSPLFVHLDSLKMNNLLR
jgi:hypothetical protein